MRFQLNDARRVRADLPLMKVGTNVARLWPQKAGRIAHNLERLGHRGDTAGLELAWSAEFRSTKRLLELLQV